MQWNGTPNAGFTMAGAKPCLAVNPNYPDINAAKEESDPKSILHYTQQAIALHHGHLAFVYGDYKDLDPDNAQVYAYPRTLSVPGKPDERFLVVLNFGEKALDYTLPEGGQAGAGQSARHAKGGWRYAQAGRVRRAGVHLLKPLRRSNRGGAQRVRYSKKHV
jgi:glycosidase